MPLSNTRSLAFVGVFLALGSGALARQTPTTAGRPTLTTQDYIDIQQVLNKYAFALDTCSNNGYDYADLYTPDGVFYWGINSRKSVGREQLAEAAGGGKLGCKRVQAATPQNPIQTHVTVNAVIETSPEGATVKSYLVYPGVRGVTADPDHTGYVGGYQDVFVKTPQGWRIKTRIHIFPPNIPGTYVFPADEPAKPK